MSAPCGADLDHLAISDQSRSLHLGKKNVVATLVEVSPRPGTAVNGKREGGRGPSDPRYPCR